MELPRTTKYIVKQIELKQIINPVNMFASSRKSNDPFDSLKPYFVVGDLDFKRKFCQQRGSERLHKTLDEFRPLEDTNINTTYCNQTMRIQDKTIFSKLSIDKQLDITRQQRTFTKFSIDKSKAERIRKHLVKRLSHFSNKTSDKSMTFQREEVQVFPNPELIDLVNDNIPEYWKNSLRDNEKRLKRHIKGHTFKQQVAEEMLQTIKGKTRLVDSIPKIKQEFMLPGCARLRGKTQIRRGLSLMGKKVAPAGEDMRSWANQTVSSAPKIQFAEVHKLHFDSANRWRAAEQG